MHSTQKRTIKELDCERSNGDDCPKNNILSHSTPNNLTPQKGSYSNRKLLGDNQNKFIKNKRVDSVSMRYISRMGYSEYSTVSSKFNLRRPK